MTRLERAILGLLALQPGSGYDLLRVFETTSMGQFSGSPGAIYPALSRLEARGVLSVTVQPGHGRSRKVYSLTEAGHEALRAWFAEPVTWKHVRDEMDVLLLRFSVAESHLQPAESATMLSELRLAVAAYLEQVEAEVQVLERQPLLNPLLALEHGITTLRGTLKWIDRSIDRLQESASAPAPGGGDEAGASRAGPE